MFSNVKRYSKRSRKLEKSVIMVMIALIAINAIMAGSLAFNNAVRRAQGQDNLSFSRVQADSIVDTASALGNGDVVEAEIEADRLIRDAQAEADRILAEARSQIKHWDLTVNSDLTVPCYLSAEDYENILPPNLKGLGVALEEADKQVNGLYLYGLICLESGYGTSSFAQNRNNLVGWNANDSNPSAASSFDSKEQCVAYVAEKLRQNYLTPGGKCYYGVTPRAVNTLYCTSPDHADKIVSVVNNALQR